MALDAPPPSAPSTPARRSIETPSGIGSAAAATAGSGSARTITSPVPMSRNPFASSRRRGRPANRGAAPPRCAAVRPIEANSTRTSVSRRSKAPGSSGQRTASSRFQNGSRSTGSWSRIAVAEVAQVATRDRVDARLVEQQATHRGGVDRVRRVPGSAASGIGHRRHHSRDETCARPESYPAALRDREDRRPTMSWRPVAVLVVGALLALAACGRVAGVAQVPRRAVRAPPRAPSPAVSASPAASVAGSVGLPPDRRSGRRRRLDRGLRVQAGRDRRRRSGRSSPSPTPASSHTTRRSTTAAAGRRTLADRRDRRARLQRRRAAITFHCTVHAWMTGTITIAP